MQMSKCVKIDEYDVLDNVNVMTQDDVTLINNAEMLLGNDNDGEIGSAVSSVYPLSNVDTDISALTSDSVPSEVTSRSEHDILRDEQKADPTLKKAWLFAQKNKNNFFVEDELLYHLGKVLQLCLPIARREEVCRMARDMCHKGYKRTKEKMRLIFFWPDMSKAIRE